VRKVKPSEDGGLAGVSDRRLLVFIESLTVEGEPVSQSRETVTEVGAASTITGIVNSPLMAVALAK